MKHDFAWGDTRGIREIMVKHIRKASMVLTRQDLNSFGYPPHEGEAELINEVRNLIKKITGKEYKHILITNGATHALNAYVAAQKNENITGLATRNLYFSFYPKIAANHNLHHELYHPNFDGEPRPNHLGIIDSPSNPEGIMTSKGREARMVWDAAYHSPTYCGVMRDGKLVCPDIIPPHEAMVGSMNKLTGINGLRIGWLATNSNMIYARAFDYVEADLCGVSGPSQDYAVKILKQVDLQPFFEESKRLLDNNRTELERLSYLFGGQPIFPYGMFALFEVDDSLKYLFKRAEVKTMGGKAIGDTERDSIRINLANPNAATKAMVDAVLKEDKK